MTIYKKNSTKEEKMQQVKEIVEQDFHSGYKFKTAQNAIIRETLEVSNNLDIPKKIIKSQKCGGISTQLLANLAACGYTNKMIAQQLGIEDRTLRYIMSNHPEAVEAIQKGRSVMSSKILNIALNKIYKDEDKNNSLLKMMMQDMGIGVNSIKIEQTVDVNSEIKVNVNNTHKEIMNKIFAKEDVDAIEADFEEVEEDKK